jgi:hypothetical protein
MANNFKKQVAQTRAAVPQVDPESTNTLTPVAPQAVEPQSTSTEPAQNELEPQASPTPPASTAAWNITTVDTKEVIVNCGFHMYPSRHRQIARDLAYIEERKPWQIIEDALEEYVVRHYGKEHRRK